MSTPAEIRTFELGSRARWCCLMPWRGLTGALSILVHCFPDSWCLSSSHGAEGDGAQGTGCEPRSTGDSRERGRGLRKRPRSPLPPPFPADSQILIDPRAPGSRRRGGQSRRRPCPGPQGREDREADPTSSGERLCQDVTSLSSCAVVFFPLKPHFFLHFSSFLNSFESVEVLFSHHFKITTFNV